jgi:hypothetical protein
MTKYSSELKLQAVLAYLEGKESFSSIAQRFKVSLTPTANSRYYKSPFLGLFWGDLVLAMRLSCTFIPPNTVLEQYFTIIDQVC